jgi:hypothetical protein
MDNSILVYGFSSEQIEQVTWAAEQNNLGEVWETDIAADIVATNYFAAVINFAVLNHSEKEMVFEYYNEIQTPLTKLERKHILKTHGEQLLFDLINIRSQKFPLIVALNLSAFEKRRSPVCFISRDEWYQSREELCQDFLKQLKIVKELHQ